MNGPGPSFAGSPMYVPKGRLQESVRRQVRQLLLLKYRSISSYHKAMALWARLFSPPLALPGYEQFRCFIRANQPSSLVCANLNAVKLFADTISSDSDRGDDSTCAVADVPRPSSPATVQERLAHVYSFIWNDATYLIVSSERAAIPQLHRAPAFLRLDRCLFAKRHAIVSALRQTRRLRESEGWTVALLVTEAPLLTYGCLHQTALNCLTTC